MLLPSSTSLLHADFPNEQTDTLYRVDSVSSASNKLFEYAQLMKSRNWWTNATFTSDGTVPKDEEEKPVRVECPLDPASLHITPSKSPKKRAATVSHATIKRNKAVKKAKKRRKKGCINEASNYSAIPQQWQHPSSLCDGVFCFSDEAYQRLPFRNEFDFSRMYAHTFQSSGVVPSGVVDEAFEAECLRKQVLDRMKVTQYKDCDVLVRLTNDLKEPNIELLDRILHCMGTEFCLDLLKETLQIEANGGLQTITGKRRTPGGVFLHLLRQRIPRETIRFIWDEQTQMQKQRKRSVCQEKATVKNKR